jgi:hypothetical protein
MLLNNEINNGQCILVNWQCGFIHEEIIESRHTLNYYPRVRLDWFQAVGMPVDHPVGLSRA